MRIRLFSMMGDNTPTSDNDFDRKFLSDISTRVCQSEELQNSIAAECLTSQIIPKLCSSATLIVESNSASSGSITESGLNDQLAIYLLSLQAMVLFCRREVLVKGTASATNIALLSENLSQIFTSSTSSIPSMNALVAYLYAALVMVLASDSDERQKQLLGLGVHRTMITTIRHYLSTHNFIACEMSLRALRNIAAHDESAGELVKSGFCELIVDVIRAGLDASHEKRDTETEGLKTAMDSNIVSNSVKESVVLSIRAVSCLELLEAALWATVNLSFDADASVSLGVVDISSLILGIWGIATDDILLSAGDANGEVKRIDVSLARNLDRLRILNAFTSALRNLSYASPNFASFETTLVCEVLVCLITSFSDTSRAEEDDALEREILSTAIWGVVNFSCSAKLGSRFVRLNAVEVILEAVKVNQRRFAEERYDSLLGPIAEAAIFALRNLANTLTSATSEEPKTAASDSTDTTNTQQQPQPQPQQSQSEEPPVEKDLQSHFGDGVACKFLFDMLTRYVSREGMVEACCGAVVALCGGDGQLCSLMAVGEGAFLKLFTAAKEHVAVVETVEACLRSMVYLLHRQHADCVSAFLTSGGLRFIVECLDSHRRDYDVVKYCCEILLHTRYPDVDSRKALSEGGQIRALPSKHGEVGGEQDADQSKPVEYYATPAGNFLDIYAAWKIDFIKSELDIA